MDSVPREGREGGRSTSPIDLAAHLERTLVAKLPHLRAIPDGPTTTASNRPSGIGWSRREELGHLIDSAVNNHSRFVRASLQPSYEGPGYEQEGWVRVHHYRETPWGELISLWEAHNRVLVPLIAGIPDRKLSTPCRVGDAEPVTLGFLVEDYVLHMQHHLDQILQRDPVTRYP